MNPVRAFLVSCFILSTLSAQLRGQQNNYQGNPQGVQSSNATPAQGNQVQVPLMSTQQAAQEGVTQVVKQPFPDQSPEQQQFVNQVLQVWEQRTAGIKRYECDFQRWEYDPGQYADSFYSQAWGKLKFMDPDKGMFVVDRLETIAQKTPQPVYKPNQREPHGEYWICDGQWVYIRDRNLKEETQYELPPEMRGQGIHMSPLPFLFGVKADELRSRYWLRDVSQFAPPGDSSVWLEAWPKRSDDAGNYSRVQVVLDRKDILPRALIVFLPNWQPGKEYKEIYEFKNRIIPKDNLWNAVKENLFKQSFIPTKLPADWKVVKHPYIPAEQQVPQTAQAPPQQPVR